MPFAAHNESACTLCAAALCFAAFYFHCHHGASVTGIDEATHALPCLPYRISPCSLNPSRLLRWNSFASKPEKQGISHSLSLSALWLPLARELSPQVREGENAFSSSRKQLLGLREDFLFIPHALSLRPIPPVRGKCPVGTKGVGMRVPRQWRVWCQAFPSSPTPPKPRPHSPALSAYHAPKEHFRTLKSPPFCKKFHKFLTFLQKPLEK